MPGNLIFCGVYVVACKCTYHSRYRVQQTDGVSDVRHSVFELLISSVRMHSPSLVIHYR